MTYIPHTETERAAMLAAVGASSLDDLFAHLPAEIKTGPLKLPDGLGEMELSAEMARRARKNRSTRDLACFLGAGAYDHFIPPVVDQLILRGELYTAYTPYQPEISQGILQMIYEYQTMIASLCGCDVANASLYDGATALAEGCQMALRHTGRNELLLDGAIHPHYLETVASLLRVQNVEMRVVAPCGSAFQAEDKQDRGLEARATAGFQSNLKGLAAAVTENTAAIAVGYPNFFGAIEDLGPAAEAAHNAGALLVAASIPFGFGLLQPPGAMGADVVCGEAQSLGVPLQFGGPYLGYIACKDDYVRRMPGRLVGQTLDIQDRRAFTLTLQAREQHIRREKATSNICTNEALCAMMAHFYLSCVGRGGLKRAGELCALKTDMLRRKLRALKGVSVPEYPAFNEFVIETPQPAAKVLEGMLRAGILGGLDLGAYDKARGKQILVAVTEKRTVEEMERYAETIKGLGF